MTLPVKTPFREAVLDIPDLSFFYRWEEGRRLKDELSDTPERELVYGGGSTGYTVVEGADGKGIWVPLSGTSTAPRFHIQQEDAQTPGLIATGWTSIVFVRSIQNDTGNNRFFLAWGGSSTTDLWAVGIQNGQGQCFYRGGDGFTRQLLGGNHMDDRWHMIVGVLTSAGLRLYFDGAKVNENAIAPSAPSGLLRWPTIGGRRWGPTVDSTNLVNNVSGSSFDEVIHVKRPLTDGEVADLWQAYLDRGVGAGDPALISEAGTYTPNPDPNTGLYVVSDDFEAPDNTPVVGRTPKFGPVWEAGIGNNGAEALLIENGRARQKNGPTGNIDDLSTYAVVPCGQAAGAVFAMTIVENIDTVVGVRFRTGPTVTSGYLVNIRLGGRQIRLHRDGVQQVAYNLILVSSLGTALLGQTILLRAEIDLTNTVRVWYGGRKILEWTEPGAVRTGGHIGIGFNGRGVAMDYVAAYELPLKKAGL